MSAELPAKKSNASRYLFLFLLGLVFGAVLTFFGLRTWLASQDPFPHSVMHVMGKHRGLLTQAIKQNRCAATDTVPHVRALRTMSNDLELAFPDLGEDQRFSGHASQFRGKLDAALTTPPTDCAGATKLLETVKESCDSCHQDFGH